MSGRTGRTPWLFLTPHLSLFSIFLLFPLLGVLALSTFDWSLLGDHHFVGGGNYEELLRDPQFWRALGNTVLYALAVVPLTLGLGFVAALALNQPLAGKSVYRAALYLPFVLSSVASATAAAWMFDDQYGVINAVAVWVGLPRAPWLTSTAFAMPAVVATTVWLRIGLCMLVYLAALQDVPRDLLQAAEMDGANAFSRFRYIVWPQLLPSTAFLALTTLIYSFHAFDLIYVMTDGGPGFSTTVLVQYLYEAAFQEQRQGYASAISVVLLVILAGLSSLMLLRRRRGQAA